MFGFNPYAMIGGAVAALAIVASFTYQSHEIHKYHTMYNCVNSDTDCAKNSKVVTVPGLQARIAQMVESQKNQTSVTTENVTKVVKVPVETTKIITEIKKVPVAADCTASDYPEDVTNAF